MVLVRELTSMFISALLSLLRGLELHEHPELRVEQRADDAELVTRDPFGVHRLEFLDVLPDEIERLDGETVSSLLRSGIAQRPDVAAHLLVEGDVLVVLARRSADGLFETGQESIDLLLQLRRAVVDHRVVLGDEIARATGDGCGGGEEQGFGALTHGRLLPSEVPSGRPPASASASGVPSSAARLESWAGRVRALP